MICFLHSGGSLFQALLIKLKLPPLLPSPQPVCGGQSPSYLVTTTLPIHRNLQANQRRRGQKYSKWNCWNSGVFRMSLRKAMSKSDSVNMMSSSSRVNSSPIVTRNRRNTLKINLLSSSTSGDCLLLTIPRDRLLGPNSAACLSFEALSSDSFSSSMLQGAPLRCRAKGMSVPCSATGVGRTLSEGL